VATNEPVRAGDLIGRHAYGSDGEDLGRIADLVVDDDTTIVAAIVTRGPWGRLLGYERESAHGPWLLERFARAVLRRESRRVAWEDLRLADEPPR
jgi:sporulation protein YlmC with PRC-barrel domain